MSKALKSFRLGAEMIRRGSDLSRLSDRQLKGLAARGLAESPDASAVKDKPAAKVKTGAKAD